MKRSQKSILTVVGSVGAVVLLSASTAFACLNQKGSITLTPSGGTAGTTVTGTGSGMNWCAWPATAASVAAGGSVTVAVASGACSGASSTKLSQGTYEVRLNSDTGSPSWRFVSNAWQFQSNTGCWKVQDAGSPLDTTYSVSSTGSGSESVTIPSGSSVSDPNEAAGLCVGNGTDGIFAPLKIT